MDQPKLLSVQDGDTITVLWKPDIPMRHRLRLLDIDAPELGEPMHRESLQHLAELIRGASLRIEYSDRFEHRPDPNNRLLVYLWNGHHLVNEEMVRNGFATLWIPNGPSQHTTQIAAAKAEAQDNAAGIWSCDGHPLCALRPGDRRRRPK